MAERFVQYTAQAAEENAAFPLRADKSSPLKRHPPLRECIGSSSMQSSFLPRKGVSYVASGLVMAAIALLPADAAAGNASCGKRQDITPQLQQNYKERLAGLGIHSQGGPAAVLAAPRCGNPVHHRT